MKHKTLNTNFAQKYGAPPGSKVIATPNAYMINEAWNLIAEDFAKGLRQLPVINKYPDLWMVMTLDGFGSHLEGDALKLFAKHKILVVKEEGVHHKFASHMTRRLLWLTNVIIAACSLASAFI